MNLMIVYKCPLHKEIFQDETEPFGRWRICKKCGREVKTIDKNGEPLMVTVSETRWLEYAAKQNEISNGL